MAKKKDRIHQLNVHPVPPADVTNPPKPRRVRARRAAGSYELVKGALDLGLVRGDEVMCSPGTDGVRYIDSVVRLREGTLSYVQAGHYLCEYHRAETIDQITDDWRNENATAVEERGGIVRAFWPARVPLDDVRMAVDRSAAEYGLPCGVLPSRLRLAAISVWVNLAPFPDRGR